jgi:tRNA threonylcarbamoyl adenosine modification protein YjeE
VTFRFTSHTLEDTERLARALARALGPGIPVGLSGDLGAGKTALVRAFVQAWTGEPDAVVTSPTFTLLNRYNAAAGPVHHFDLYRLGSYDELEAAGGRELLFAPDAVAFVEWVERIEDELDVPHLHLEITLDDERRLVVITPTGDDAEAALARLRAAMDEDKTPPRHPTGGSA